MKMKSILAGALIAVAPAATSLAQQQPGAAEGAIVRSEPGSASVVHTVQLSAEVVAIDKGTRTVTLKGPEGDTLDVVASGEVKNFDQIKVGDTVSARYSRSLALKLRKTKDASGGVTMTEGSSEAPPGERPGLTAGSQITAIAEVTAVDPKESTITLKGPRGKSMTLEVHNPEQFKVVKPGDQVDVTYTEAVALSVEPAADKK